MTNLPPLPPPSTGINYVLLVGRVKSARRFSDTGKVVLTVENQSGRFYVEHIGNTQPPVTGERVMISGWLFSRLSKGKDTSGIHASQLQVLDEGVRVNFADMLRMGEATWQASE